MNETQQLHFLANVFFLDSNKTFYGPKEAQEDQGTAKFEPEPRIQVYRIVIYRYHTDLVRWSLKSKAEQLQNKWQDRFDKFATLR